MHRQHSFRFRTSAALCARASRLELCGSRPPMVTAATAAYRFDSLEVCEPNVLPKPNSVQEAAMAVVVFVDS